MTRDCARPQRQARSGVTYKESDDDDDDFVPTTRLPSDKPGFSKGKRTLTLKRARTTLEPPVSLAKEEDVNADGDVYALPGGAVEENSARVQFRESAERVLNAHRRQSSAFECLLEAVSDASGDGEGEEGGSSAQKTTSHSESKPEVKEEETSAAYGPELLAAYSAFERKLQAVKGVKEEDATVKKSTDEETRLIQGTKDINEKSSGDEKTYVRRGERAKLDTMPPSKTESKKVSGTGEQDKPYDMSSTDDDEENDSWNESSDASDTEKKKPEASVTVPAPPLKINQDVKSINLANSDVPSGAQRVVMPAKPTSAPPSLPKKRPALWSGMTKPFVPPGPKTLQTPTAHRRVVGLSRRHRPPPLHPYLLES